MLGLQCVQASRPFVALKTSANTVSYSFALRRIAQQRSTNPVASQSFSGLLFEGRNNCSRPRQRMSHKPVGQATTVVFALAVLANAALAGPVELTDTEMDQITAGAFAISRFGD